MNWQYYLLMGYFVLSITAFLQGLFQCIKKKNGYGETPLYNILGAFVWTDAVVFGLFWSITSIIFFVFNDWLLFLLIFFVFWIIRSFGEMIYWFHEQFAEKHRNKPKDLFLSRFFPGDSVYIAYQILWQCMIVIYSVGFLYILRIWK